MLFIPYYPVNHPTVDSECTISTATHGLLVTLLEHKLREAFLEGIRGYVQLGHFIILRGPISQQIPELTSL